MWRRFCLVLVCSVIPVCGRNGEGPPGSARSTVARSAPKKAATFAERLAALQARLAKGPTNIATLYEVGRLCYDQGGEGDRHAVKLAEKYFRRILDLDSKQALARALLGSTLTMRARDSFWPPTRFSYVHSGLKDMDAAVRMAPDDPHVRFVRAFNNAHMPRFMGRSDIVRQDFAWLWQKVRARPDAFTAEVKQNVALYEGRMLKKAKQEDKAVKVWRWGLKVDPKTEEGRQIEDELLKAGTSHK